MSVQREDRRGAAPLPETEVGSSAGLQIPTVFSADTQTPVDALDRSASASFLAEVVTHKLAETPFCIGIFGPAGSGKSSFLATLLDGVAQLNAAAEDAGLATPFLSNITVARVDAASGVSPPVSLLRQVAAALTTTHPRLAAEAEHAGVDPRAVAQAASDRLADTRQRLEAERRSLDGLRGHQARLAETLLFDTPGSLVDEHARRHRGRIERVMRSFGAKDDVLTTYRQAVRDASEHDTAAARWTAGLRAFWGFRGQGRLLVVAALLVVASVALGVLDGNQDRLIGALRSSDERMAATADWLDAHWQWLATVRHLLELGAVLAVAANVARGFRFLTHVHRGAGLLIRERDSRRREIDGQLAQQTRRVDTLARDAEAASRHAAEAETRVSSAGLRSPVVTAFAGPQNTATEEMDAASSFFASLGRAIAEAGHDRLASSASAAPARLVVAIDGLDRLPSNEAAAFLQMARRLFGMPGFVVLATSERLHLLNGLAETDPALAAVWLDRLVQIPYTLADGGDRFKLAASYARALLDGGEPSGLATISDGRISALDRPWTTPETALIEGLAPFAGATPRALKRFVNLYRVARADPRMSNAGPKDLAGLAIGLAFQTAGSPVDPRQSQLPGNTDDEARQARKAASMAFGLPLTALEGALGYDTARRYSAGT